MKQSNGINELNKGNITCDTELVETRNSKIKTTFFYFFGLHVLPVIISIAIGIIFAIIERFTDIRYANSLIIELITDSKVYVYFFTYLILTGFIFKNTS